MMRTILLTLFCVGILPAADWKLVWSDEFNGPKGAAPNPKAWTYDLGANGWGNQELEEYTSSRANSFLDGEGHLVIRAIKTEKGYTSARLKTQGLYEVKYGRVAARLKLPAGQGIWPAWWMLGENIKAKGWPDCGEIDVMEFIGKLPDKVHFTLHGPGYSGGDGPHTEMTLANPDDFHVYGIEWAEDSITFLLDDRPVKRLTPSSLPSGARWAFNQPFFLILNLAVGGQWPGNPDSTTVFPQDYVIDWVRVWQRQ